MKDLSYRKILNLMNYILINIEVISLYNNYIVYMIWLIGNVLWA